MNTVLATAESASVLVRSSMVLRREATRKQRIKVGINVLALTSNVVTATGRVENEAGKHVPASIINTAMVAYTAVNLLQVALPSRDLSKVIKTVGWARVGVDLYDSAMRMKAVFDERRATDGKAAAAA